MIGAALPFMITARRYLHSIPELGFAEEKTSEYVARTLAELGLNPVRGQAGTSVTAILDSGKPGPYIMLRADMDALPVSEDTGLPFASTHAGCMHACGHDGHTAMLLGTAKVLLGIRQHLVGKILFVFQPAEEDPGGAEPLVKAGVLKGVDYCLGAHIWPEVPLGCIGVREGPLMSAVGRFEITVAGKGGHGAQPHLCVDALEAAQNVCAALRRIPAQKVDPFKVALLTIGCFQSGQTYNVIPDEARIMGSTRAYDMDLYREWGELISGTAAAVAAGHGTTAKTVYKPGHPAVINPPELTRLVRRAAVETAGEERVVEPALSLAGEDFSCYQEEVPGCFFFIGSGEPGSAPLHNPRFDFKEDILALGPGVFCRTVLALGNK